MTISAIILAATLGMAAQANDEASLTVTVEGLAPQGAVMLAIYGSEEAWAGSGDPVEGRRATVEDDMVTIEFATLPAGEYAIRLYHDVDGDGELDTNLMGIPSEPFGFSNNARGRFGPASWADAVFTVTAGANTQIVDLH